MTHVTCRLTAKNRDQLWNPTLGNRVWAFYMVVERKRHQLRFMYNTDAAIQHTRVTHMFQKFKTTPPVVSPLHHISQTVTSSEQVLDSTASDVSCWFCPIVDDGGRQD